MTNEVAHCRGGRLARRTKMVAQARATRFTSRPPTDQPAFLSLSLSLSFPTNKTTWHTEYMYSFMNYYLIILRVAFFFSHTKYYCRTDSCILSPIIIFLLLLPTTWNPIKINISCDIPTFLLIIYLFFIFIFINIDDRTSLRALQLIQQLLKLTIM